MTTTRMVSSPQGALLQVNKFCNLTCSHCSLSAPLVARTANRSELSIDQWSSIFKRLHRAGVQRVRFTGGEPFLRDDLEQLSRAAYALGLEFSFVTNGLSILPNHLRWLTEVRPKIIWVSVYGFPEPIYDEISGRKGGLRRLEIALQALLSANLEVGVYYPLGDKNLEGVAELIRRLYLLGIRNLKVLQVLPHGRAAIGEGLGPIAGGVLGNTLEDIARAGAACDTMRIRVSMRSGQSALFESKGFAVPISRSCQIGLQNLWTLDSRGFVTACCLFLNTGRLDLFSALERDDFSTWRRWDRTQVLRRLAVETPDVIACPALPAEDEPDSRADFVCPLTYAELKHD